jgi:hypothetical protein
MKRTFFAAAAGLIAALALAGPAKAAFPTAVNSQITDAVTQADADGSGDLDRVEWHGHGSTTFADLDGDGDGSISQPEYDAAQGTLFDAIDADHDDRITLEEILRHLGFAE